MVKQGFVCILLVGLSALAVFAQQPAAKTQLAASIPTAAAVEQSSIAFDANKITVKYSAPSMGGKKVFGGIVPYKQVWPIGGASAATFHTESDLVFRGVVVPKGEYSLYLLPEPDKMQLIISKQVGPKTQVYNPKMDLGRVPMVVRKVTSPVEACKLTLTKTASRAGRIEMSWENTMAFAAFQLDWAPGDPEW
ncbi:MAG: DUF2911 domain-containing protein [Bryobacteraceae bacterium]